MLSVRIREEVIYLDSVLNMNTVMGAVYFVASAIGCFFPSKRFLLLLLLMLLTTTRLCQFFMFALCVIIWRRVENIDRIELRSEYGRHINDFGLLKVLDGAN